MSYHFKAMDISFQMDEDSKLRDSNTKSKTNKKQVVARIITVICCLITTVKGHLHRVSLSGGGGGGGDRTEEVSQKSLHHLLYVYDKHLFCILLIN